MSSCSGLARRAVLLALKQEQIVTVTFELPQKVEQAYLNAARTKGISG
jgi:hypothetical protein